MVFYGLTNNNKIISNLKHYQSKNRRIYIFIIFKILFYIYIKVHYQNYQK
jgi:hypothetical protein